MLDDLQPSLRFGIMSILATVYETGLVDKIDMTDVLILFGIQLLKDDSTVLSFDDDGWIEAYISFRENGDELSGVHEHADDEGWEDIEFKEDPDLDPDRKLH